MHGVIGLRAIYGISTVAISAKWYGAQSLQKKVLIEALISC